VVYWCECFFADFVKVAELYGVDEYSVYKIDVVEDVMIAWFI
jgi:hypothetical protein